MRLVYSFNCSEHMVELQKLCRISKDLYTLTITDGASAILRKYLPAFGLHERLVLESAIEECLISKLGVSSGKLP